MADTDRRARARLAIQRVARARGLPTDLKVLSERWNTVALLGDSGVVARAATLADMVREEPEISFRVEVKVCQTLATQGAPVQVPIGNVVTEDDFPISLWQQVRGEMGEATEQAMVETLAQIHEIGREIALDQPWFALIADSIPHDLDKLADHSVLEQHTVAVLREYFDRSLDVVVTSNLPEGLVHGDAQRKNAIAVDNSCVWIDFEDCCIGPYAWDLACLTMNPNYDTERVLDAYANVSGFDRTPSQVMPYLWALRDLEALTWMLLIQDERDQEFRVNAQNLLAEIVSRSA